MNKKALKIIISTLQFITSALLVWFCANGILNQTNLENRIKFAECIIRCICISVFSIFYYNSLMGSFGSDMLFIPLHLLFSIIAEIRIFDTYSSLFFVHYISSTQIVCIFIFSTLMTVLPLIGYCIFYGNTDSDSITRFILSSITGSILITLILPKSQNLVDIWNFRAFTMLIYTIYVVAVIVCIVTIFTDTPGPSLIRHFVSLILILSNYINLFYDTYIMNAIGTTFLICATVIIIILTKRNSIKL